MNQITDWENVPQFEDGGGRLLGSHQYCAAFDGVGVVPEWREQSESVTISLRMDLHALQDQAACPVAVPGYQSMIKQWLSERLEQETKDQ